MFPNKRIRLDVENTSSTESLSTSMSSIHPSGVSGQSVTIANPTRCNAPDLLATNPSEKTFQEGPPEKMIPFKFDPTFTPPELYLLRPSLVADDSDSGDSIDILAKPNFLEREFFDTIVAAPKTFMPPVEHDQTVKISIGKTDHGCHSTTDGKQEKKVAAMLKIYYPWRSLYNVD